MMLTAKEIDALAWIAAKAELGGVEVTHFVDASGAGWLEATITPKVKHSGGRRPEDVRFKVSPLGHVYRGDDVVREGPPL